MALAIKFSVSTSLYNHIRPTSQVFIPSAKSIRGKALPSVRCNEGSLKTSDEKIERRSTNYQRPIWDYDYVQSLKSKFVGDKYVTRAMNLKEDVKIILLETTDSLDGLKLIDDLQRLGLSYHFEDEIRRVLESIYSKKHDGNEDDLHSTSLKFKLLRQHGYNVPQQVFDKFLNEKGFFQASLSKDIRGMLQLYEASFLSFRDERIMEEAQDFATKNLKQHHKRKDIDQDLALLISHALELPVHWRMPRSEARWFIDFCERRLDMNPTVFHLAKLDFNMVQATHQEELKQLLRWWNKLGLGKKLSFGRDRLMEPFLLAVNSNFKPQFSSFRRNCAALYYVGAFCDDFYDGHGTLDELEVLTNVFERWDINAMEQLPDYMKMYFLALFNLINEMAYETLKEQGIYIIPHIKKVWADLTKSYLKEAKWYYNGYIPTLEEYMDNAWLSTATDVTLTHVCFWANSDSMEGFDWLRKNPNVSQWMCIIGRLTNDLGTSANEMKREDSPKSIQCYMNETGASEEDARDHIKYLIQETWKRMNEDQFTDSTISQFVVDIAINMTRWCMCMYHNGDDTTSQGPKIIEQLSSVLINPIPLED